MKSKKWTEPKIRHGKPTKWGWVVFYPKKFVRGSRVDIGYGTAIFAQNGVFMGDFVQVGGGCFIYSESTIDNKKGLVKIMDKARIGSNSVIMPGVTIGEDAIVGAMSFVNKNIPPGEIWAGIPAKKIK